MEAHAQATVTTISSQLAVNPRSTSSRTHFRKPMRVARISSSPTATYKDSIYSDIDSHLKRVITIRPPFEVYEPMHHLVFSTKKNIASALCVAACEAVGGQRSEALSAAAALHLMHVSATAHENLLVGNVGPKLEYPFGPNIELMTGDGVVPLGFELLAVAGLDSNKSSDDDERYAGRVVRVIAEISRAIGSLGVVDAQYKEYASSRLKSEDLLRKLKTKRSEFPGCGAACGAILGGGSEEKIGMLRRCGMFVGMMKETSNSGDGNGMTTEEVMELRDLAMKELEGLDAGGIHFVSNLVDSVF